MKHKQILLFDIDFTLIDSWKLRKQISATIHPYLNASRKDIEKTVDEYTDGLKSSTDFNPKKYLKLLSVSYKKDINLLTKLFYNKEIYKKCVYPETVKVLRVLSSKYELGIFSEGFVYFQTKKLLLSDIYNYFDRRYTFIFRRKLNKDNLNKLPKDSIIIDDNLKVAESLYKNKFEIIWLNRKDNKIHDSIPTISKLDQIFKVLKD